MDTLLYLISNAFSVYVHYRFTKVFFKESLVNNIILFGSYLLYYIINSSTFLLFHNPYLNLLTTIVPITLITFEYKSKIVTKFIFSILIVATFILIDSILVTIGGNISVLFSYGLITALVYFLLELLVENFTTLKTDYNINYNIKVLHLISILIVPLGSIVILVLNKDEENLLVVIQSSVLLIINFMVFFFYDLILKTYDEKFKLQLMEQKNKEYVHQIELNNQIQEQVRCLRHDMSNHLQRMEILLKNNDYDQLENYLNKCIETITATRPISNCGNLDIDSLINYKLGNLSKEVPMDIKINLPRKLHIDNFDLTIILGNLLDNSIEALKSCKNKYLSIRMNYNKGVFIIDIKNSYTGNIKINGDILYTTKLDKKNHGIGLQSVQNTLKHYDGKISYTYNDDIFQVKVMLFDKVSI